MGWIESAVAVTAAYGLNDGLTKWVNEYGQTYGQAIAEFISPVLGSREAAEAVVAAAPWVVFGMTVALSTKDIMRILFNKEHVWQLTEKERGQLASEVDEQAYARTATGLPPAKDFAIKADPSKTRSRGVNGDELMLENGQGSGIKGLPNKTVKNIPPHAHGPKGEHLRIAEK